MSEANHPPVKDNQDNAEQANAIGMIKSIIKSINYATSREELAYLIRVAKDYIHDYGQNNQQLLGQLEVTAEKVEMNICEKEKTKFSKHSAIAHKNDEELLAIATNATEIAVNLACAASVLELAKRSASGEKAGNVYDGAFGETLRAIEAQEAKEHQRVESRIRVDTLRKLGETIRESQTLAPEAQDEIIAQAAQLKINLHRDEKGKLVANAKDLKTIEKIAQLNMSEVHAKRQERQAQDKVDNMEVALAGGGLGSLFGDDDFIPEAPKKPDLPPSKEKRLVSDTLEAERPKKPALLLADRIRKSTPPGPETDSPTPTKSKESFVEAERNKPVTEGWVRKL